MEAKNRILFQEAGALYQFYVSKLPDKFRIQIDQYYSWYINDTILITQGGIGGKVLHGNFKKFYPNNNLMEEGYFIYGQKDGLWKQWTSSGKLKNLSKWKKGKRKGQFVDFDESGRKIREGRYKNNELNGRIIEYEADGKKRKKLFYKHGKIKNHHKKKKKKSDQDNGKAKQ